ncbi:MAG: hypothetical protein H6R04_802 [Burkholderiaceae bacterium]|nr:hypothetical protein [Burkholderiaceae bacterium]
MSPRMKNLWKPWIILASIFTVGMAAFLVFTTPTNVSFPLVKGTKLTVSAFRLQQSGLPLILEFKKAVDNKRPEHDNSATSVDPCKTGYLYYPASGEPIKVKECLFYKRPEHGSQATHFDWRKTGYLYYVSPGEPVKIRITKMATKESVIFEATPGDACNDDRCRRRLVPYIDDGDPKRFTWPPTGGLLLPAGNSDLQIDVMEVGERISGEQVTLKIEPPLDFKFVSADPLSRLLWWFFFWPFYAFVLLAWAILLILIGLPGTPE